MQTDIIMQQTQRNNDPLTEPIALNSITFFLVSLLVSFDRK